MRILNPPALLALAACLVPARSYGQSGLLLGLQSPGGYRTLWIAPSSGHSYVVKQLDDLVIPTDSGFFRISVDVSCELSEGGQDGAQGGPYIDHLERVSRSRLAAGKVKSKDSCASAEDSLRALAKHTPPDSTVGAYPPVTDSTRRPTNVDSANAFAFQRELDDGEHFCNLEGVTITFASSRYLSYRTTAETTEFCSPARYTSESFLRVVDHADESVSLLAELPPRTRSKLVAQWEKEKGDCATQESPDGSWGIDRGLGVWRAVFATSGAVACRGESGGEVTLSLTVPETLARNERIRKWLPVLRRKYPQVRDFVVSPRGDLAVAIVGDTAFVHFLRSAALGPVALRVPLVKSDPAYFMQTAEQIVLVEWAVGGNVGRWSAALTKK